MLRQSDGTQTVDTPPLREVPGFISANRETYSAHFLGFGLLAVFGGWFSDRLQSRGRPDAYMRGTMLAALLLAPCAILFPLSGAVEVALVLLAGAVFFGAMPTGTAAAALQAVTPDQMRAKVSALYLFTVNLIGTGVGPGLVGLFTDFVFADTAKLNLSLMLTAAVTVPPGAALLGWGLKHYRVSLEAAAGRPAAAEG